MDNLVKANDLLEWSQDMELAIMTGGDPNFITLDEIVKQLPTARLITVIIDRPLDGEIWQYENYRNDDRWWKYGNTKGYA